MIGATILLSVSTAAMFVSFGAWVGSEALRRGQPPLRYFLLSFFLTPVIGYLFLYYVLSTSQPAPPVEGPNPYSKLARWSTNAFALTVCFLLSMIVR